MQTINLIRVLFNPRITSTPRRVLRELKAQGKQRLPEPIQKKLGGHLPQRGALSFIREWLDGEQLSRHRGQWVLNSFLPPFPSRAFNRMFENLLSGRRLSPVSAFLAVTSSCPYKCWHCSLGKRVGGHLSTNEWRDTIRQLHELGASIIGFTGGEPMSRPDLPQLVEAANRGGAETIVFTSGALLEEEKVGQLKRAGLWSLCVSLDSEDAAEHDRLRGAPGAFAQAMKAIKLARSAGFYTMIGAVASRPLVERKTYQRIHQLAGTLGVHEFRLVEPMPCGLLTGTHASNLLTSEQIQELRQFHVTTNRANERPKVCAFNHIESPELFGCGAGTQHLYVDASGEVCPCDFTPMSFGNVVREPLESIWTRMNKAMGNPRRHCFIQRHQQLIARYAQGQYPLPCETSARVCMEAGFEPLPDYFALVTHAATVQKEDHDLQATST